VLPSTLLSSVFILSSNAGIDINNFRGSLVRVDQAFTVGPTEPQPPWKGGGDFEDEDEEPIPYGGKEEPEETNGLGTKEVSIVDMPDLLQFVAKRPEDTFISVKEKNVKIMDKGKVEQFVSGPIDPTKMVQVVRKKQSEELKRREDTDNIQDIPNVSMGISESIFEAFAKVPNEVKLNIFKEYQSQFISTLHELLDDGVIDMVTRKELDQLQIFDNIVIDAMKKIISGEDVDETTKRMLKTFQDRLITVVNEIIEEKKEVKGIKNVLINFKKLHTYQIVSIIFRMNTADLLGINQMLQLMKTEKELIDDIKKHAAESMTEKEKDFYNLPDDKKIEGFKKYQSNFISSLEKMLQEDKIVGVTKAQLSNLRDFENAAVDALSTQLSGDDLDEGTRKKLKVYEASLITAINDVEGVLDIKEINHDLEELKKHHAYFIVSILYGLNSGEKISSRQVRKILNLMAIEEYLLQDINKILATHSTNSGSSQPNMGGEDKKKSGKTFIPGSLVDIVTRHEAEKFKENHPMDDFFEIEDELVKLMNSKELEDFKTNEGPLVKNEIGNGETKGDISSLKENKNEIGNGEGGDISSLKENENNIGNGETKGNLSSLKENKNKVLCEKLVPLLQELKTNFCLA